MTVWDFRRGVRALVPDPEVRATATSTYTVETIDRRVADLRARPETPEIREELAYLERVRAKRIARDAGVSV